MNIYTGTLNTSSNTYTSKRKKSRKPSRKKPTDDTKQSSKKGKSSKKSKSSTKSAPPAIPAFTNEKIFNPNAYQSVSVPAQPKSKSITPEENAGGARVSAVILPISVIQQMGYPSLDGSDYSGVKMAVSKLWSDHNNQTAIKAQLHMIIRLSSKLAFPDSVIQRLQCKCIEELDLFNGTKSWRDVKNEYGFIMHKGINGKQWKMLETLKSWQIVGSKKTV